MCHLVYDSYVMTNRSYIQRTESSHNAFGLYNNGLLKVLIKYQLSTSWKFDVESKIASAKQQSTWE